MINWLICMATVIIGWYLDCGKGIKEPTIYYGLGIIGGIFAFKFWVGGW